MYRLFFAPLTSIIPSRLTRACGIGTLALTTAILGNVILSDRVQAQAQFPACQPPQASEYLLLALIPTREAEGRVVAVLPNRDQAVVCNYLGQTVLRIGGFTTQESANAWSNYVAKQAEVSAFVAKPPTVAVTSSLPPFPPSTPTPIATLPSTATPITPMLAASPASPQSLGTGYAVLVNYHAQPAVATEVRESTGQPVSLVAYGQQPFLLASFTSNQSSADVLLKTLTDRGMWAMIVDGRRVMLLKPNVVQ
jgi:hypothetical protein